jgi:PAS domain S-box-containing protein
MISTVWDVTKRKNAENELLDVSSELQMIFDNMINAFVVWDSVFDENGNYVSFRFKKFNKAYAEISQLKLEDVLGKDVHEVWPDTEDSWVKIYGQVATTGVSQIFEMYHESTRRWYHCNAYRPTGSSAYICVIFNDITQTKLDDQKIQKIQTILNNTQKISQIGGWEYDIQSGKVTWTDEVYEIHEVPHTFDPTDVAQDLQYYLEPDRKILSNALNLAIEQGVPYDLELQISRLSGGTIWVRTIGVPEIEDGKTRKISGYIMNINEKKLQENRVTEQINELQRWQKIFLDREDRTVELKKEINQLSIRLGDTPPYPSVL